MARQNYRSLLNLAKENKLTESFLWIPSLEGPTFDSPPTEMMSWLKDWSGASEGALLLKLKFLTRRLAALVASF